MWNPVTIGALSAAIVAVLTAGAAFAGQLVTLVKLVEHSHDSGAHGQAATPAADPLSSGNAAD